MKFQSILFFILLLSGSSINANAQKQDTTAQGNIDFTFVNKLALEKGTFQQFFYKSGEKSSEGMMDGNLPIGNWVSYFKNGNVKTTGIQWKGHPVGSWVFFDEDQVVQKYYSYDSTGLLHGQVVRFDSVGCTKEIIHYKNGIKEGPYKSFHPNGNLKKVAFYSEGVLDGKAFEYSQEDGRLLTEEVYRKGEQAVDVAFNRRNEEGKKSGPWKTYYPDGTVKIEANYTEGVLDGIYKEYKKNGELRKITRYEMGIEDEDAKEALNFTYYRKYYDDGSLHMFGLLKKGMKNGIIREYDRDGAIINGYIYNLDTLMAEGVVDKQGEYQGSWEFYYPSGELRATGSYVNNLKDSVWTYYYRDGSIEQKGEFNEGEHSKYWRWYFKNGDLRKEEYYRRGKLDGQAIEYDSTRNIIVKGMYLNGLEEGEWFYDVGDHIEKGQFTMGLKTGEWRHYYSDDELKFKGEYKDDLPFGTHIYYHENGVKHIKGKYERGEKDGVWNEYNEMGERIHYIEYDKGKEIRIDGIKVKD